MIDAILPWAFELALKSTLVFGLAFVLIRLGRRLAAAERHLILVSAIVCTLALPALSRFGPGIELPVIAGARDALLQAIGSPESAADAAGADATPERAATGATGAAADRDSAAGDESSTGRSMKPAVGRAATPDIARALASLYLAIAAALLVYSGVRALGVLRHVRALPETHDTGTTALVDETRRRLGLRRRVRVLSASAERTPWAFGLSQPAIVLPADFARWPLEERRAAVVHELSHIARLDQLSYWLGQLCCALYWFQPLAWTASARLNREAERACDDRVLLAGIAGAGYARQLLAIANKVLNDATGPVPDTAMARPSLIGERIRSILDSGIRRTAMTRLKTVLTVLAGLALVTPIATLRSQQSPAPAGDEGLAPAIEDHLAAGETEQAVTVLADWVTTHPGCDYCADILRRQGHGPASGPERALAAAFDDVEQRALAERNGEWLVRLAGIALASEHRNAIDRGKHYLFEAHSIGNVGPGARWIVLQYLVEMGRYDDAQTLVARMREDPSLPAAEAASLEQWSKYLANETARSREIAERLIADEGAVIGEKDFLPVYKESPAYPAAAAEAGLEGSTVVEYTVTKLGHTRDLFVVSSTDNAFAQASIEAAANFRYLPRTVGGVAVDVPGVRTKIDFRLERNRDD